MGKPERKRQGFGHFVRAPRERNKTLLPPAARNLPRGATGPVPHFVSIFKNRLPDEGAGPARFVSPLGMRFEFLDGKTKGTESRYVYLVSAPQNRLAH